MADFQFIGSGPSSSSTRRRKAWNSDFAFATGEDAKKFENKDWSVEKATRDSITRTKTQPQPQPEPKKSDSLFGKIVKVGKAFGSAAIESERAAAKGIARVLPGGTADIEAERKQAEQADKDIQYIKNLQKQGRISADQAAKIIKDNAGSATEAQKQLDKTVKNMPTTGQVAAGFAGTAADILSAGTFKFGKSTYKLGEKAPSIIRTFRKVAPHAAQVAGNAAAGGFNAAAAGGDKGEVMKNATAGALLPEILHYGSKGIVKGTSRAKQYIADTRNGRISAPDATKKLESAGYSQNEIDEILADALPDKGLSMPGSPKNIKLNEQSVKQSAENFDNAKKIPVKSESGEPTIPPEVQPITAYHGSTNDNLTSLIPGAKTGLNEKRNLVYLSEDQKAASNYAKSRGDGGLGELKDSATGKVYPVQVHGKVLGAYDRQALDALKSAKGYEKLSGKTKNMLSNDIGLSSAQLEANPELVDFLRQNGVTAVRAQLPNGGGATELAVIDHGKIKIAQPTQAAKSGVAAAKPKQTAEEVIANDPKVKELNTVKKQIIAAEAEGLQKPERNLVAEVRRNGGISSSAYEDLPRSVKNKNGPSADYMARTLGFKSEEDFVNALTDNIEKHKAAPKTKAEALKIAEENLKTGKSGYASDYREITDAINNRTDELHGLVAESHAEPVAVPTEGTNLRPLESVGDQKQGVSKLASSVNEKSLKQKLISKAEAEDLPTYNKADMNQQAEFAVDLLRNDPQKAIDIALGRQEPPAHILSQVVYNAVEEYARGLGGDEGASLLLALAKSKQVSNLTKMGQEIRAAGERDPHSPANLINEVSHKRAEMLQKRGKSLAKEARKDATVIKRATPKITEDDWTKFVNELRC